MDALYGYEIGKGGLLSYTGSNDAVAIEDRALDGHEYSRLLYEGIAYQTAKAIGGLATVVQGQVRAIILTGGMARSKLITEAVEASVGFIAPVYVYPGELEMGALAAGGLRVMRGEEQAQVSSPDAYSSPRSGCSIISSQYSSILPACLALTCFHAPALLARPRRWPDSA